LCGGEQAIGWIFRNEEVSIEVVREVARFEEDAAEISGIGVQVENKAFRPRSGEEETRDVCGLRLGDGMGWREGNEAEVIGEGREVVGGWFGRHVEEFGDDEAHGDG